MSESEEKVEKVENVLRRWACCFVQWCRGNHRLNVELPGWVWVLLGALLLIAVLK